MCLLDGVVDVPNMANVLAGNVCLESNHEEMLGEIQIVRSSADHQSKHFKEPTV